MLSVRATRADDVEEDAPVGPAHPAPAVERPEKRIKRESMEAMEKAGAAEDADSDIEVVSHSPAKLPTPRAQALRRSTSDESLPSVEAGVERAIGKAASKAPARSPPTTPRAAPIAPKPVAPRTPSASTSKPADSSAWRPSPSRSSAARPTWAAATPMRRQPAEGEVDELREDSPPRPASRPLSPRKRKPLPVSQAKPATFTDPVDRPPAPVPTSRIDIVIAATKQREMLLLRPPAHVVEPSTFLQPLAPAIASDKAWQLPATTAESVAKANVDAQRKRDQGVPAGPTLNRPSPRPVTRPSPTQPDQAVPAVQVSVAQPAKRRRRFVPGELVLSDDSGDEDGDGGAPGLRRVKSESVRPSSRG